MMESSEYDRIVEGVKLEENIQVKNALPALSGEVWESQVGW